MTKILYQPVSIESINNDSTILRNSKDRFDAMLAFCQERFGESLATKTFLDIGCCYGYFMDKFSGYCQEVAGIEYGEKEFKMSKIFYSNISGGVRNEDFTETINSYDQYNIVAALSVLHTIIVSNGIESATEMLQAFDNVTSDVMFLEMGQEHEKIYSKLLEGWNKESIAQWVIDSTTFDFCEPLIEDSDPRFGRTLFVCYRNQ